MKKPKNIIFFAAVLGAALVLTGCAEDAKPDVTVPEVPVTPEPPEEPEVTPEPEPEPVLWERFIDERLGYSFEVPEDWTVELQYEEPQNDFFAYEIYDELGARQLVYYSVVYDTGEACSDTSIEIEVTEFDSTPIFEDSDVRFVYRIAHDENFPYVGSLAITSGFDDHGGSCVMNNISYGEGPAVFADSLRINFVNPEHGFDRDFSTQEKAEAFMETEEYATLKRILVSLRAE